MHSLFFKAIHLKFYISQLQVMMGHVAAAKRHFQKVTGLILICIIYVFFQYLAPSFET